MRRIDKKQKNEEFVDLIYMILLFSLVLSTVLIYFYLVINIDNFSCIYNVCFYSKNLLRKISIVVLLVILTSIFLFFIKIRRWI